MIWGIDPASKKIALFGGDPLRAQVIKVPKTNRGDELYTLRDRLEQIIGPDDTIYVEEPVLAGARNIRSTLLVAETVGMILSVSRAKLVEVSTWKKSTVGKGNASKDDVRQWLEMAYPQYAEACDGDQDLIDAAGIFVHGRGTERFLGQRQYLR